MTNRRYGQLFLAVGTTFSLVFLSGGGVLGSSSRGYWTAMFAASYLMGLLFPGPLVYWLASRGETQPDERSSTPFVTLGVAINLLGVVLAPMFFFESELGMHLLIGVLGVSLAQFIPIGFGLMQTDKKPSQEATHLTEAAT